MDWPTATQAFLNDARDGLAWVADRDRWAVWNGRCWAFDAKGATAALVAQRWIRDCAEANGQPALRTRARAHHELLDHAKGPLLRPFRAFEVGPRRAPPDRRERGHRPADGRAAPHDPTHLITRKSPVVFNPNAAGEFPARLLEIFRGDTELAGWFRREIGMAATGFDQAKRVYFSAATSNARTPTATTARAWWSIPSGPRSAPIWAGSSRRCSAERASTATRTATTQAGRA